MFPIKPTDKRLVYLDHAATTPVHKEVLDAMLPYFTEHFGNPSALYHIGREVKNAVDQARKMIAGYLGTQADSIIFCSGGTESDNMAIFGVAKKHAHKGKHIITSEVEHHAVLHACEQLEKEGFEVTYLRPDETGLVSATQVKEALRPDTILVSIMYANNEIGTVEPIADIGREILKWRKAEGTVYPYFHTDACQAAGVLDLNVEKLHVDLLTMNGSKLYGPKGIGVLYKRRGFAIQPLIVGGAQEFRMRAGTEHMPGIIGFAKAFDLAQKKRVEENTRLIELRAYFWKELQKRISKIRLNGPELDGVDVRLPNNLNISILDIEGEALLLYLDEYGIVCSTGSACTSESLDPSHVLLACGLPYEYAHGSIRFTLGASTSKEDIDYVLTYLPAIVEKLREISPVRLSQNPTDNTHPTYLQR
ncbi:aminotransferase class V-fold PLP-dependent enzyme [Patescibacteria group bacterium]|nr:aminotransferase class V-fold PLP-dependent enzyme [Patescibacteria group bacterium]MBU1721814.1 aminotransferase class V-fold PLP-dependent enzyme [Patescibacteria group bacterium]MBU1901692.1 aminotransferase class V-fold PLP-dependent enzyme [Patescibacteria group bacterium]